MPVLDRIEEHTWSNIEEFLREKLEHFDKWKELHGYSPDVKIDDVDPIDELEESDSDEIARILAELYPNKYFIMDFDDTEPGFIIAVEVALPQLPKEDVTKQFIRQTVRDIAKKEYDMEDEEEINQLIDIVLQDEQLDRDLAIAVHHSVAYAKKEL